MKPKRKKLPDERQGLTRSEHLEAVGGAKVTITTGEYDNGTLGEIFLEVGHEGSILRAYDMASIFMSFGLQHGIPLELYVDKMEHQQMEPAGVTSNKDIPIAKSVWDFLAKWLRKRYLNGHSGEDA
jgi:ribonucleoside-diphosphate reductase alpha chain